jgi:hypothetical protein
VENVGIGPAVERAPAAPGADEAEGDGIPTTGLAARRFLQTGISSNLLAGRALAAVGRPLAPWRPMHDDDRHGTAGRLSSGPHRVVILPSKSRAFP